MRTRRHRWICGKPTWCTGLQEIKMTDSSSGAHVTNQCTELLVAKSLPLYGFVVVVVEVVVVAVEVSSKSRKLGNWND